jgi:glycosyltransferase involved in cell wall biosynthesis
MLYQPDFDAALYPTLLFKYITQCLDSVFLQDIPESEYEVICVNDCYPDNSREIETYSKPLYYYRKNESSETGNISAQKCNGFYEMACIIAKLKSDLSPLTEEWDIFYTRSIVELLNTFLCYIQFVLGEERDAMISKLKSNDILLYEFKKQGRIKSHIKVWLIKHATWLLFLYFRIIRRITRGT